MKVRYLIKYSKGSDIKFVGHLDLMRTIQRTIKRADLPIEYSHGFNPHMTMSIAQPLSVGVYSDGEYMDVKFSDEIPESEVKEKFNKASTNALKIVDVVKIRNEYYPSGKKVESSMAVIEAAVYDIKIRYENISRLKEEMESLLKSEDWSILKKTKKSEKIVNIRSMVKKLSYNIEDNALKIHTAISSGSRENLSPDLLCDYIKKNTHSVLKDSFTDIKRVEMYAIKNRKLVPLNKYFS